MQEYSTLLRFPPDGKKVMAYGHKTYCCVEDMDEEREWHYVTFELSISEWKHKKSFPDDLEESLIQYPVVRELWKVNDDDDQPAHLIGVTKWRCCNEQ